MPYVILLALGGIIHDHIFVTDYLNYECIYMTGTYLIHFITRTISIVSVVEHIYRTTESASPHSCDLRCVKNSLRGISYGCGQILGSAEVQPTGLPMLYLTSQSYNGWK